MGKKNEEELANGNYTREEYQNLRVKISETVAKAEMMVVATVDENGRTAVAITDGADKLIARAMARSKEFRNAVFGALDMLNGVKVVNMAPDPGNMPN